MSCTHANNRKMAFLKLPIQHTPSTVLPPLYYRKVPASKKRLKITTTLGQLLFSGLRCRSASNAYTTSYARVGVTQLKSSKLQTEVHQGSDDEAALPHTWFTALAHHRLLYNFSWSFTKDYLGNIWLTGASRFSFLFISKTKRQTECIRPN